MSDIERLIIARLIKDESFTRKALPNIKAEYFKAGTPERVSFELVESYVSQYGQLPGPEALIIELQNRQDLSEDAFRDTAGFLEACVMDDSDVQTRWLLDKTEEYCKDRAFYIAVSRCLEIMKDEGEKGLSKGAIPKLFQDALAVTFDPHIGHDYFEDAETRYEEYHRKMKRVPFDIDVLNHITGGGLPSKTLNVIMAVSNAGKSLMMCHMAAANLMQGYNVLYVTLELSQDMVATRIDGNLMGVDLGMLKSIPKQIYDKKIRDLREKTTGKLVVKEYSQAGASHFRHLLSELKMKKGFVPDIIYVDYLNICVPTGRKGEMNSYERVKCIAEELRAVAVDFDVPVVTATQSNRSAYGSSQVGMENVSDSLGLPMTADWMIGLIETEELKRMGQYKVIQLKSRYDDIGKKPFFFLGVQKSQMRVFELDSASSERTTIEDEDPPKPIGGGSTLNFAGFK